MSIENLPVENVSLIKPMGGIVVVNPITFEPVAFLHVDRRKWDISIEKDHESVRLISEEEESEGIVLREYFYGDKFINCYYEDSEKIPVTIDIYDKLNEGIYVL